MTVVPFFSTVEDRQRSQWLDALQGHLPEYRVLHASDCSEAERLAADVAIVASPDPTSIATFPNLKWMQSLWAGVEALLAIPGLERIPVTRMIDPALAETMSEAVLAWTLYLHRDMPAYRAHQSEKRWRALPMVRACDRHVGILGCGELGRSAIEILIENRFMVSAWSRSSKSIPGALHHHGEDGLKSILREVDILVCLLPLTDATYHLLGDANLVAMKKGAALINFGRGELIDTTALLGQLDRGHLHHAVLDVFETEPLPTDSVIWSHPSITVLPHISAPTNVATASAIAAANVRDWLVNGGIPAAVDRTRGY